jgi:hypothetical protein
MSKYDDAIKLPRSPAWERTNDVQGHKPKFEIRCFRCEQNGIHMPMAIRHSQIFLDGRSDEEEGKEINQMAYKCPRCAWFIRFYVVDDLEYLQKVKKEYRKGSHKFIPSCDNWSEEFELIGKKLKSLGYW